MHVKSTATPALHMVALKSRLLRQHARVDVITENDASELSQQSKIPLIIVQ